MIEHGSEKDILGRTYEYCLSMFAEQEGKRGGEFFTPSCIVRTLVEVLQPFKGRVYDPCCGSGGMFVQSAKFVENHSGSINDISIYGVDWQREKWQSGFGFQFIRQGEKNAVKYADEIIVLSKGVQDYFKETYGRETHFIPNGVNRPQIREANLITDKFGLKKDSYILFLGRLVPEKGIRYLVEAFKNVRTDKKLVIAGGSSDTDSFIRSCGRHHKSVAFWRS